LTLHKLEQVLAGDMDEFVEALRAQRDHAAVAEAS
jgi:protein subunit release factor A